MNTLPSPWRLSAWITPPMRSTRFLVMAMPSPVPWMPLVVEFSSRLKGSNTVRRKSGLMPMPLSRTIKRRWAYWGVVGASSSTVREMAPPSGVYLMALDSRLIRIWFRCSLSPSSSSAGRPFTWKSKDCSRAWAWGSRMLYSSSISSGREKGATFREVLPLSILLMSSTSLMRLSRWWLEEVIFRVYSRTLAASSASLASRVVKPMMAFMGVRMSWDILDRNALLASLARLAWDRASRRRVFCSSSTRVASSTSRTPSTMPRRPSQVPARTALIW